MTEDLYARLWAAEVAAMRPATLNNRRSLSSARERIVPLLKAHPAGLTTDDIIRKTGLPRNAIRMAIHRLGKKVRAVRVSEVVIYEAAE